MGEEGRVEGRRRVEGRFEGRVRFEVGLEALT